MATAVFLAHCGSFLPCDKAIIGLTDGIYTRIASAETCTVQQSTFTIDLLQMNTIFRNATANSLIVVDEFGKGSAEIDGQALLVASINHLQHLQVGICADRRIEMFRIRKGACFADLTPNCCMRLTPISGKNTHYYTFLRSPS